MVFPCRLCGYTGFILASDHAFARLFISECGPLRFKDAHVHVLRCSLVKVSAQVVEKYSEKNVLNKTLELLAHVLKLYKAL